MPQEQLEAAAPPAAVESTEFDALLKGAFKPRDDEKQTAIRAAVQTLAEVALKSTRLIPGDALNTINALIAELDKMLSQQINLIMHHENFKSIEATWRGLHHLVNNTETDEMLKIRVLNIS